MSAAPIVIAILADVAAHLAPETWTQGSFGRDEAGRPVHERDADAVCWCLFGHVVRSAERVKAGDEFGQDFHAAADELKRALTYDEAGAQVRPLVHTLSEYNDAPDRTFDEVAALVQTTRERLARARRPE